MDINQTINAAYRFELVKIKTGSTAWNPHHDTIMQMENGEAIWEVFNILVESHFRHVERYQELEQFTDRVCEANEHMKDVIGKQAEEIADLKQQLFDGKDNPIDDLPF